MTSYLRQCVDFTHVTVTSKCSSINAFKLHLVVITFVDNIYKLLLIIMTYIYQFCALTSGVVGDNNKIAQSNVTTPRVSEWTLLLLGSPPP